VGRPLKAARRQGVAALVLVHEGQVQPVAAVAVLDAAAGGAWCPLLLDAFRRAVTGEVALCAAPGEGEEEGARLAAQGCLPLARACAVCAWAGRWLGAAPGHRLRLSRG
jgi:hypothetical protein